VVPSTLCEVSAPARVLVVEDNDVNAMVLIEMMKLVAARVPLRLEIDVAKTAEEARAKWPRDGVSLVLLGINLPDGREDEVCWDMTRDAAAEERPFVVCVPASVGQMRPECLRSYGIDRFLSKPVRVNQLAEQVTEWHELRVI
jgi:CheY-like chemotaxis protein